MLLRLVLLLQLLLVLLLGAVAAAADVAVATRSHKFVFFPLNMHSLRRKTWLVGWVGCPRESSISISNQHFANDYEFQNIAC